MQLHDTDLLRKRANWHAKNDHIVQGTYGKGAVNGEVFYLGCAIGCLSTPHTKTGLKGFLRELFGGPMGDPIHANKEYAGLARDTKGDEIELENDEDGSAELLSWYGTSGRMVKRLGEDFGVCPELARAAEAIFESLPTHGEAIDFIPAFAAALEDGMNIDGAKLRRAWPKIVGRPHAIIDPFSAEQPHNGREDEDQARASRDRFIGFLAAQRVLATA